LRRHARKSHELGGAKTFLAINDSDSKTIIGFYSVSPAAVAYARTPEIVRRGLARHDVPAFRLPRLAVDRRFQGKVLAASFFSPQANAAFWPRSRLAESCCSLTQKMKM
jgi:hypothetical protein